MNAFELQEFIRKKMDAFPTKTRRVAEYLLTHSSKVAFLSISEVADRLSVSKAQLVRVARMLGFEGYSDLKSVLKQALLEQVSPSSAYFDAEEAHKSDIPENLRRLEQANIDETFKNLSPAAIVKFCEAVKTASALYCMGWGISALVAEWFYTRFTELGLRTVLVRRGSMSLIEQTRAMESGDMLIVCELPSYVIEVTEAVEKIYRKGSFVVTLTDSPAAPICRSSHLPFHVGDVSPTFGSSLLGPMFAVHVLTSVLAFNLGEEGQRALTAQKEGLGDERVYYPAYGLRY
ncbi:MAG: MurR/RpiR family transcriptional regulator [Synergistaceae bacterium]|jgi:DNA-binding MurR/RpiR family transcriptional regulator|nr:MurR/RpiR family transcriptional regulator [Synergistaceae bacterium]